MIFPKYYTDQLTEIFLKKENGKQTSPSSSSSPIDDEVDGEIVEEDVDGEPIDDVDGEPMDEDLDGEPLDDEELQENTTQHLDLQTRKETESLYTDITDMFS
jgi:hypothetical protein